jgi:hypothetical protein
VAVVSRIQVLSPPKIFFHTITGKKAKKEKPEVLFRVFVALQLPRNL